MTIVIHWWYLPVVLTVLAFVLPDLFAGKKHGDYDVVTPLFGAGLFLMCIIAAICVILGHFLQ